MSRPGDRVASNGQLRAAAWAPRKVRTPQSTVVANGNPGKPAGKCNRK